jgi:hypothetical protein
MYLMSLIYPFILGIITKVYDDIIDINLPVPKLFVRILQSLMIVFIVLTTHDDFYLSFSFAVVSYLNDGFDNPFWKSLFPISLILTMINLPLAGRYTILKIIMNIIIIFGILLIAIFEDRLFPEEVSVEKIFFRFSAALAFTIVTFIFISDMFPFPKFSVKPIIKTSIIMGTNMFISTCIMFYLLYFSGKSLKELNGL